MKVLKRGNSEFLRSEIRLAGDYLVVEVFCMCANPHTRLVITPKNAKLQYISQKESAKLSARSLQLKSSIRQRAIVVVLTEL